MIIMNTQELEEFLKTSMKITGFQINDLSESILKAILH